jgi:serine/threonine protein kinase
MNEILNFPVFNRLLRLNDNETCLVISELGRGTFGQVYLVEKDNIQYALKIITERTEDKCIGSLIEIDVMNRLVHPNIVTSHGIYFLDDPYQSLSILMSLGSMDLKNYILKTSLTIQDKIKLMFDITSGVKHLHDNNILHLDLKPGNILIFKEDNSIRASITDFGISMYNPMKSITIESPLVTINYRPPEIFKRSKYYRYDSTTDIWSLGMIYFFILSNGQNLFPKYVDSVILSTINMRLCERNIDNTLNTFFKDVEVPMKELLIDLVRNVLKINPLSRFSIDQILKHSIFSPHTCPKGISKNISVRKVPAIVNHYQIFDYIYRIGYSLPIRAETMFLTCDLIHRLLSYGGNLELVAITCLVISSKMIELFRLNIPSLLASINNKYSSSDLIQMERQIILNLKGIIYPHNIFNIILSREKMIIAFDWMRNVSCYYKIDGKAISELGTVIPIKNIFDRSVLFRDFFVKTTHFSYMSNYPYDKYIQLMFESDVPAVTQVSI